MKNAVYSKAPKFLIAAVITASFTILTLGACTPEDRGVTNGDTRLKIQNKNKQKKGAFFQVGPFAMTSVMSDQLIEAIELVQVAYGRQTNSSFTATDLGANEDGEHLINYAAEMKDHAFTTSQGDFVMSLKKTWGTVITAPGKEIVFVAKSENAEHSVKKLNSPSGKATLGAFRETESIIAIKSSAERPDILTLGHSIKGSLDASNTGLSTVETFEISVMATLDKAAFEAGEIKILDTVSKTSFIKAGGKKPFVIRSSSKELALHSEYLCHSLTGAITIDSDRNKKQLVLSPENAAVSSTGWQSTLAACGTRPTVDLSRMLIK